MQIGTNQVGAAQAGVTEPGLRERDALEPGSVEAHTGLLEPEGPTWGRPPAGRGAGRGTGLLGRTGAGCKRKRQEHRGNEHKGSHYPGNTHGQDSRPGVVRPPGVPMNRRSFPATTPDVVWTLRWSSAYLSGAEADASFFSSPTIEILTPDYGRSHREHR